MPIWFKCQSWSPMHHSSGYMLLGRAFASSSPRDSDSHGWMRYTLTYVVGLPGYLLDPDVESNGQPRLTDRQGRSLKAFYLMERYLGMGATRVCNYSKVKLGLKTARNVLPWPRESHFLTINWLYFEKRGIERGIIIFFCIKNYNFIIPYVFWELKFKLD